MVSLASSTTSFDISLPDYSAKAYFASSAHEQALQSLQEGLSSNTGDLILTGAAGSGKTRLLHEFMQQSQTRFRYIYCAGSDLDFDQLLGFICDHLKLPLAVPSRAARLKILAQHLSTSSTTLILLIDDADKLQDGVIGHLLMLQQSLRQHRSLRLLLCGRESLLTRYERQRKQHPLPAVKAFCVHLTAIDSAEIAAYLQLYGGPEFNLSTVDQDTLLRIEHHTKGNPASLNSLLGEVQKVGLDGADLSAQKIDTIVSQRQQSNSDQATKSAPDLQPVTVPDNFTRSFTATASHATAKSTRRPRPRFWPAIAITLGLVLVFASALIVALLTGNNKIADGRVVDIKVVDIKDATETKLIPTELTPQIAHVAPALLPQPEKSDNPLLADQSLAEPSELIEAIVVASQNSTPDTVMEELQFWKQIKDSQQAKSYELYLQSYPTGIFAAIAQQRISQYTHLATAEPATAEPATAEPATAEIDNLLDKAERAFAAKALTSPQPDNAVHWLAAVLAIDPENSAAKIMLAKVIDTYIDWAMQSFEKQHKSAALTYLQRGRGLSEYASEQQLLAMNALNNELNNQLKSKHRTPKRRRTVARSKRRDDNSFSAWLKQVDTRMQKVGQAINRSFGVRNQRNGINAVDHGFSDR